MTLHLVDGRRLYGWPEEWPDQPEKGHFVLDQPQWLLDSGERAPLYKVERFVVSASDVKMVEFIKEDREVTKDPAELQRVERLLLDAQTKEKSDGSESPEPAPNRPANSVSAALRLGSSGREQKSYNGPVNLFVSA